MRKLVAVIALGAMSTFGFSASALTTDGSWDDWFTYGGMVNDANWVEGQVTLNDVNIRTVVDEEGPTPGGGGQDYDIEQIFYFYEDFDPNSLSGGILHVGLVTGFPPEGRPGDDLFAGDMFIGFGSDAYDLAIATSTSTVNHDTPGVVDNDYYGNNYFNDNWVVRDPTTFPGETPWRVNRDPALENLFNTSIAWGGVGSHNFLEISVELDGALEEIVNSPNGGISLHWTMECGNDVINVRDTTPLAPSTPVPEPSTFALLGLGMLGVALRKKFTA